MEDFELARVYLGIAKGSHKGHCAARRAAHAAAHDHYSRAVRLIDEAVEKSQVWEPLRVAILQFIKERN